MDDQINYTAVIRDINKRKITELQKTVIYQISEATHSAKDLDALYRSIHKILDIVLDVTNFYIATYDEMEKLLSFPSYIDSKDVFPAFARPLGKGLTEYIIRTGKPLILRKKDVKAYAEKGEIEVVGTLPEVWMGSPLKIKNKVIGVIGVNSYYDVGRYSKSDLKILTFVAEQIAIAIEQKQSITELEVEKTYLNELFTSSPEALALVATDSTILHINTKFTSLFGYREEEAIGKNIDDLLSSPKDHKDAEIIKKSEEKYRTQSIELSESNAMKELLLDIITHDLRNPAGVIKGFAQFGLETDPNNEILIEIDECVDNLLNVISNATTLSKVALGDTINKEELDLISIIKIAIDGNSSQLEFAEMKLDFKMVKKLKVTANPIICEVFRNYISNAIKYAIAGKKIIV